jgi:uncharacterized protein (TIGR00369 family)
MELSPDEAVGWHSPFDELVGTQLVQASGERVVARLAVDQRLHQPAGVVHGGVYATVIEAIASTGATLAMDGAGGAVGLGNHTEFLRPVSDGELTFVAEPLQQGRSVQLWQASVTDERGRAIAHGTVRLYNRYED